MDIIKDNPAGTSEVTVDSLKVENAGLSQDLKDATQVIADLKNQLTNALMAKAATSKKPTVEVDGVMYEVNHGAAPYTADELAANPEACKQILVITGQNALKKVE